MHPTRHWLFALPVLCCASASAAAQAASGEAVGTFLATSSPMAISYILSVTAMKIVAFVIGYLIVRLGHDTLIKGVSGEIDFGFSGSGIETKLKAASPGTFFVLAGAAVIIWALFVEKPITLSMTQTGAESEVSAGAQTHDDAAAADDGDGDSDGDGDGDEQIKLVRPAFE